MPSEPINLLPLLKQRLAEDMLPETHEYWKVLDLVPPSPEGLEKAHEESGKRLRMVAPLQKHVDIYSAVIADIVSQIMLKNLQDTDPEMSEDTIDDWHKMKIRENREIVRGCMYPILAQLIDSRVLVYGPEVFSGGLLG